MRITGESHDFLDLSDNVRMSLLSACVNNPLDPLEPVDPLAPVAPLDLDLINAALGANASRLSVELVDSCPSTNTLLLSLAQNGAPSGRVVLCENQTAGRGRRGRTWHSAPGDSLTFSLLWRFTSARPPNSVEPLSGLSLAVGLAVARALEHLGISDVQLKWPNDILLAEKKLGGILVETRTTNTTLTAVIGIGLNVRPPTLTSAPSVATLEAASISSAVPTAPSRNILLATVLNELTVMLDIFSSTGFTGFAEAWNARHAYNGRSVRVLAERVPPVEGRCVGVESDGALLLETKTGVCRIVSGEVSLRPL